MLESHSECVNNGRSADTTSYLAVEVNTLTIMGNGGSRPKDTHSNHHPDVTLIAVTNKNNKLSLQDMGASVPTPTSSLPPLEISPAIEPQPLKKDTKREPSVYPLYFDSHNQRSQTGNSDLIIKSSSKD